MFGMAGTISAREVASMIQKHNSGWRVTVYSGQVADRLPEPHTGKKRLTRVVSTARRDAEALEREWKNLIDSVRHSQPAGATVAAFVAAEFLPAAPSSSTRTTYKYALARFLAEHGDTQLTAWTVDGARRVAADYPRGNVAVVRNVFAKAFDMGRISANPFRDVRAQTRGYRKTKEHYHKVWGTDPQAQRDLLTRILDTAANKYGPDFRALVAWSAWTGCRQSESRALPKERVNVREGYAHIESHIDTTGVERAGAKNRLAREIVVPPIPQLLEALDGAPTYLHSGYFLSNGGKRWNDGTIWNRWNNVRSDSRLAIPDMTFHDLRHFCATQFLELGVSQEDVAIQLGHTDGGDLVRKVYGHPSEAAARQRIRHTLAAFAPDDEHIVRHTNFGQRLG